MAKKLSKTAQIRAFVIDNPTVPSAEVAKKFDVKSQAVSTIKWQLKQVPKQKVQKFMGVTMATKEIPFLTDEQLKRLSGNQDKPKARMPDSKPLIMEYIPPADPVNHPEHYKAGGIETIDFIEAKGLGYHLGNVVKYISRAGKKGTNQGLEDLRKAQWYLARAIEKNEYASPNR